MRAAANGGRGFAWMSLALVLLTSGCAGSELAAEARGIRTLIQRARTSGAYRCAPGELALAESHVEFAEQELHEGETLRARDHLRIADWNAREAVRLSPESSCARAAAGTGKRGDSDRDGFADAIDKCPFEPEDKDGFDDEDGCADPDDDKDGLLDPSDRCPREAEDVDGFEDQDGCPDADNDQDGVSDKVDRCPGQKEDTNGVDDGDGCPDADQDGDGVADAEDRCPKQAGPRAEGGCPGKAALIEVTAEKIELRQAVYFDAAKPVIRKRSYPLLDEVAAALKARPSLKVRVEGHTDSRGRRAANVALSQARADAVRAYLVGHGIDPERLEAKGFGPDQPIETNKTAAGRDRNRRVEFVLLQP